MPISNPLFCLVRLSSFYAFMTASARETSVGLPVLFPVIVVLLGSRVPVTVCAAFGLVSLLDIDVCWLFLISQYRRHQCWFVFVGVDALRDLSGTSVS